MHVLYQHGFGKSIVWLLCMHVYDSNNVSNSYTLSKYHAGESVLRMRLAIITTVYHMLQSIQA